MEGELRQGSGWGELMESSDEACNKYVNFSSSQ